MQKKVVLTMAYRGNDYSSIISYLTENGIIADWKPLHPKATPQEIIDCVKGYDACIAGVERWTQEVLDSLANSVKIVARFGIGYETIDLIRASVLGIAVTNTPGTVSNSVAEAALLMMLNLARRTCVVDSKMKSGIWCNSYIGSELNKKTVGLIGFGNIAKRLAALLKPFSCQIISYDINIDTKIADELSVQYAPLDKIATDSDYISIHLPLTNDTKGMIDIGFLSKMKSSAYLINTSRGGIVKESDLIKALQQNTIAGAGLDVFEEEPVDSKSPLLKIENVVLTPHISANTIETIEATGFRAADNIIELFNGRSPKDLLNHVII